VVAEVEYSPYRLRLDIERKLATGGFSEDDAYQMAITKSKHWKYEEEVRVFVKLADCRLEAGRHFESLCSSIEIVGMVLGPLCEVSLRVQVIQCSEQQVRCETVGPWRRLSPASTWTVNSGAPLTSSLVAPSESTPDLAEWLVHAMPGIFERPI
jgi:hypothetical protein